MRHLLSIDDLGADGIEEVLRLTDSFVEVSARSIPKVLRWFRDQRCLPRG